MTKQFSFLPFLPSEAVSRLNYHPLCLAPSKKQPNRSNEMALPLVGYPTNTVAGSREFRNQQLNEVDARMRELRTQSNALADVAVLPNEVFSRIFIIIMQESSKHTMKGWLPITHVCHSWRSVALSTPALWTCHIPHSSPEFTALVLARSKGLILRCQLLFANPLCVEAVLEQYHRIQELKIYIMGELDASYSHLRRFFSHIRRVGRLTSLHVHIAGTQNWNVLAVRRTHTCSTLRHVEMRGCTVRWDSPLLSNLTVVKIHPSLGQDAGSFATLSNVLGIIRRCPQLEELEVGCRDYELPEVPAELVEAGNLRILRLSGPVDCLRFFLEHVSLRRPRCYLYGYASREHSVAELEQFPAVLASFIQRNMEFDQLKLLDIECVRDKANLLTLILHDAATLTHEDDGEAVPLFYLRILDAERQTYSRLRDIVQGLFEAIPPSNLSNLRNVGLRHFSPEDADWLATLLLKSEGIHSLALSGDVATPLVLYLARSFAVVCPRMEELRLVEVDFGDVTMASGVGSFLVHRQLKGLLCKTLRAINCWHVEPRAIDRMRRMFPEMTLIWDGVQNDSSSRMHPRPIFESSDSRSDFYSNSQLRSDRSSNSVQDEEATSHSDSSSMSDTDSGDHEDVLEDEG